MKPAQSKKLLIVEDVKTTRMLVQGMFGKQGFEILQAENGAVGVELFERERPDVVLLDVNMPVMDGFEACRRMRVLDQEEGTPILMLTGDEDLGAIEQAFEVGATDFITKPINWALLSQRVRYALRSGKLLREVRHNRLRQSAAQRIAQLGFWSWEPDSGALEWSEEVKELVGLANTEPGGGLSPPSAGVTDQLQSFFARIHRDDQERARRAFALGAENGMRIEIELRMASAQGESILRLIGERGAEGRDLQRFFGAVQNVTETRRAEALVDYLALHDELTGLGNRRMFSRAIRQELDQLRAAGNGSLLVGWIDLARFHRHNDAWGEAAGDALLTQVAQRLRLLAIGGEVARVGGDEFAVLLRDDEVQGCDQRFEHLVEALEHPFRVQDQETFLTYSVGIACYPDHASEPEQLLTLAQEAQRQARSLGRRQVRWGEIGATHANSEQLATERALRRALDNHEFHLVYQPQMDLREGRIVGVESLLRWQHPQRGLVSPVEFIPILEETGQIAAVGAWVIQEACRQARRWEEAGTPLRVGINLSARQFHDPALFETILGATRDANIADTHHVELEITESLAMENPEHAIQLLGELRKLGYKVALDDFGIGYSSLEYLLHFPLDTIKIDRAFVRNITSSQPDRAIVRAVTAIAQTLGCTTIAEGIETLRQCDFIEAVGVNEIQGYLIGKPMSVKEIERLQNGFVRPGIEA